MKKKTRLKDRVFRCRQCGHLMQTNIKGSAAHISDIMESHCADPAAPGGYWYCSYQELVPKK